MKSPSKKLDTTLFEAKATEVMEQVKQDPHNVDHVIERQMPYLCPDPTPGTDRLEEPSQSAPLSPGEQELRQATRQFCAAKSADNLRALLDLRITMQARTCALWVNSYDKDFTFTRYGVGEYPGAFWPLGRHGDRGLQQYLI